MHSSLQFTLFCLQVLRSWFVFYFRADLDMRKADKERLEEERKKHEMEKLRKDMESSQGGTVVLNTGLKDRDATEKMMLEEDDEDFQVEDEEDSDDAIDEDDEDDETKHYYLWIKLKDQAYQDACTGFVCVLPLLSQLCS